MVEGLDPYEGRNTLWAPEVVFAEGRFHMFVTHIVGVPSQWAGHDRRILHHVSDDLRHWDYLGIVPLASGRVIDAAVHPLPGAATACGARTKRSTPGPGPPTPTTSVLDPELSRSSPVSATRVRTCSSSAVRTG